MANHETIENLNPPSLTASHESSSRTQGTHSRYSFDADYVHRLIAGDAATEAHFVDYFSGLLAAKLRFHLRSWQDIQDFQQEVFLRVFRSLRQGEGLRQPERLGAYVNSVCSNILFEHFRQKSRMVQFDEEAPEPADERTDMERDLVIDQTRSRVRELIGELAPRDRNILRAAVIEERPPEHVCREFGVSKSHLRVLLYRARQRFRRLTYTREAVSTDY